MGMAGAGKSEVARVFEKSGFIRITFYSTHVISTGIPPVDGWDEVEKSDRFLDFAALRSE